MKFYQIATPYDVAEIGEFMASQSVDDRAMYFGYNMQPEQVVAMYEKIVKTLNEQTFVVVRDISGIRNVIIGYIHLARSGKRIELGIYVDPDYRGQGIGGNLLAVAMLYTFTLMGRDMEMQCINRNFDIKKLIKEYDKTTEVFDDEQIAVLTNTVENQRKAITRIGRAMWNF